MNFCVILVVLLVVVVAAMVVLKEIEREGYGGHRRGHGGHRGGRHGGRPGGRRRWWGPRYGYRYQRPPPAPSYIWYNPWYWFRGMCKNGCTSIGNGNWGCQYPGAGQNDCWFASDCYGCG